MTTNDHTPNVMGLNRNVDKVTAVMDVVADEAKRARFDLGSDAERIECALIEFFAGRDEARARASVALQAGW